MGLAFESLLARAADDALLARFGTDLNPDWKANVARRHARLKTPKMKAFVFPRLAPVIENGELVDVTIHHDEDLTAQQLRWSRLEFNRDLEAM